MDLTLQDLRTRFPEAIVTATMRCAGNRRADRRILGRWRQAALEHEAGAPFAWTFWTIALDLPQHPVADGAERNLASLYHHGPPPSATPHERTKSNR